MIKYKTVNRELFSLNFYDNRESLFLNYCNWSNINRKLYTNITFGYSSISGINGLYYKAYVELDGIVYIGKDYHAGYDLALKDAMSQKPTGTITTKYKIV